ncbi:MAG: acyl-[acyl-carrier-protein] thioesterase [Bacteroidales bacterium]|jgi:acyl-ACP thioesterase|nr:acyl-[acyl-carrier-protein] thioesterase [Bacteroidales bacterium]
MNNPIVGIYAFPLEAYTSDFRGKPTLHAIGGVLMQAATRHAEERGFGYSAMNEQNRAWVLSRLAIEMRRFPINDHQIRVRTWVPEINRLFTERCFSLNDSAGNHIGDARSLWAAIDLETRKPTVITDMPGFDRFICREPSAIENVRKIPPIKENCTVESFTVKYSDLDINGHLNSIKYIEHLSDTFPVEMYQQQDVRRFEICYTAEGRYGAQLDILKKEDHDGVFVMEIKNSEKTICSARVSWGINR